MGYCRMFFFLLFLDEDTTQGSRNCDGLGFGVTNSVIGGDPDPEGFVGMFRGDSRTLTQYRGHGSSPQSLVQRLHRARTKSGQLISDVMKQKLV